MNPSNSPKSLMIGLALFSMFFGSGNLIFPLYVGKSIGQELTAGMLGFTATAVFVPFLGIIAMLIYGGNYRFFFDSLTRPIGQIVTWILLSFWIPFGSGPRCTTLAFAALRDDLSLESLTLFAAGYCCLVGILCYKKTALLHLLGAVLTPLLLLSLALVVGYGVSLPEQSSELLMSTQTVDTKSALFLGMLEGYNTMDLIASFFFSSTILSILRTYTSQPKIAMGLMLRSGVFAIALLTVVYAGLIALAAHHSFKLDNLSKDRLLPFLAGDVLGYPMGLMVSIAIALACLTTSIALTTVFTDFLQESFAPYTQAMKSSTSRALWLLITALITFFMACQGFETISRLSEPVFQVLYPLLIALILWNLSSRKRREKALQLWNN